MLLLGMPLWPVGLVLDSRVRPMGTVAVLYVAMYSLLPHKEVPFVRHENPCISTLCTSIISTAIASQGAGALWLSWRLHAIVLTVLSNVQVRFLFPVLPLFNAVAATGLAHVWQFSRRRRSIMIMWHVGASIGALICLSIVLTALAASHFNYPGGTALQELHAATQSSVSTDIAHCTAHDLVLITADHCRGY